MINWQKAAKFSNFPEENFNIFQIRISLSPLFLFSACCNFHPVYSTSNTLKNSNIGLLMQAALEYVEERGGSSPSTTGSPTSTASSTSSTTCNGGATCACASGACSCRRAAPALIFVHAGLYQEECLAIDSDVQLIGKNSCIIRYIFNLLRLWTNKAKPWFV